MLSLPEAQAIFFRRRHQPRRPPLAKVRPEGQSRRWRRERSANAITVPKSKSVLTLMGHGKASTQGSSRQPSGDEPTTPSR
jgi:hypothetical protein